MKVDIPNLERERREAVAECERLRSLLVDLYSRCKEALYEVRPMITHEGLCRAVQETGDALTDGGVSGASLRFRVDIYCSGGWQRLASFVSETDAYEYGERYVVSGGARVWNRDTCIAVSYGRRSWKAPPHDRNCDGKPCECGAVPPLGSRARGRGVPACGECGLEVCRCGWGRDL